ncbi:MAG: arginine--tRNA ligase [Bacteroidota bacterium]
MKNYLISLIGNAAIKLSYLSSVEPIFSIPKIQGHGDLSTNIALLLSKPLNKSPRDIAKEIVDTLEYDSSILDKIEIAGPGFINFFFNPNYSSGIISKIIEEEENFGRSNKYSGKRGNVEFVSANPTGPLTVGHGRNAVIGDTVANMLEAVGYEVDREYYFNNAGRQMRVLGDSVKKRYLELIGEQISFPEEYYQGEYIKEIALKLQVEFGDNLANESEEGIFKQKAEEEIFSDIKKSLESIGIVFKKYFNEYSLYEQNNIQKTLEDFSKKNLSYEKDGAIWLKLSELGNQEDKVIVKSTGEPTYRLPDIAYHINKLERNYDLIVDLFGSDHNATYPDVLAGCAGLGYNVLTIKVLIHQFVTITEKGEIVKMSTRKANYITLDELVAEVGIDVVRYFFIMRNMSSHLNFDLELAKKHSDENPVFYLQYANARICSILRMTAEQDLILSTEHVDKLNSETEQSLIKKLSQFPEEVLYSAENFEPHKISNYLEETAGLFHRFYNECRIIGSERDLAEARIALITAVRIVIANGLKMLGLSAPERM